MKTSLIPSIGAALLALTTLVHAEGGIYLGTTIHKIERYSYDGEETTITKKSQTDSQIGIYSTLGNDFYALYTLDKKNKMAYQYEGNFLSGGPTQFWNIDGKNKNLEIHKQFNASWYDDLADVGDDEDILNYKSGYLMGSRKPIKLKNAGFNIEAAPLLKGYHTHTRCSNEFYSDTMSEVGFSLGGHFFEIDNSKSTFRFNVKYSDAANANGGTVEDCIDVVESDLESKGYTILRFGAFATF